MKDILQKIRKIEIKTKKLSDHIFSGAYHTSFKGKGMSFSEVRQYQFGDDVRAIDWNVTARYNEPFVKVFEEERELTVMLIVDISQSLDFGSSDDFKREKLTEIAATLAFAAIKNNDKIGLILFSDNIELFVPPKKGKAHVLRIIRELLVFQPKSKGTNIPLALDYFQKIIKKKAVVFMLSDFMDDISSFEKPLRIVAKKHDFTAIKINDIREKELTNIGWVWMQDAESDEGKYVNTADLQLQREILIQFEEQNAQFKQLFSSVGAGSLQLFTHENYVKKLLSYFKAR
ncbi:DUF58 domain-containing protein [Capnocytophaga sp. ARDL2]|uniref:DUF58 domain-containing protein n=1 Tax=Capnocytophaga sp. ARDL2 TaxID=3238809 RepID=UPI0035567CC8